MSEVELNSLANEEPRSSTWWSKLDGSISSLSEQLNPILVKEARQSLKSRQFVITFTLLLIFVWGWTILGVSSTMPRIYYAPTGPMFLMGYYCILSFACLLFVPFSAFRSLASEREAGTFELLQITTLTARQIVIGKLASMMFQTLVYFSAVAPCIAFTYILRGVDILTILVILGYLFAASALLCSAALLISTISQSSQWNVLLSVVVLIGLLISTFTWVSIWLEVIDRSDIPIDQEEFWLVTAAVFSIGISYIVLFIVAAAGQISFASDNRSTPLRVILCVQQILALAWFLYFLIKFNEDEIAWVFVILSAIHWMFAGSLLIGERAELAPRVRRSLPQSWVGRTFLTWFNPGSGTGYVFAISNFSVAILVQDIVLALCEGFDWARVPNVTEFRAFEAMLLAYMTIYLGIGRLIVSLVHKRVHGGLVLPFLLNVVLLFLGFLIPFCLQALIFGLNTIDNYTVLQAPNWIFTLIEIADRGLSTEERIVMAIVGSASFIVFTVNLLFAAKEVEQVRVAAPTRVVEDELELNPPPEKRKERSPWDEDDEEAGTAEPAKAEPEPEGGGNAGEARSEDSAPEAEKSEED